jgi:hypothetical protein
MRKIVSENLKAACVRYFAYLGGLLEYFRTTEIGP